MVSTPTCADDPGDQRPCLKITPLGAGDSSAQPLARKESSKGEADLEVAALGKQHGPNMLPNIIGLPITSGLSNLLKLYPGKRIIVYQFFLKI